MDPSNTWTAPRSPQTAPTYLQRPGGRLAYEVHGTGLLVVCIPGMGQLRSSYRYLIPALAGAGLRTAAMDLRGHGDSDTSFEQFDDVAAGDDALALVEELGETRAVLVGNSMGAGAAVWAAGQRPDLVAGLVLIGPFVRDVPMNPLLAWAFRVAMGGPWAARVWTAYLPSLSPGGRPPDYDDHRAAVAASLTRPGRSRAFRATTRTSHDPPETQLGRIDCPALVVMGERDPDFPDPAAEAHHIAEQLGGQTLLVPNSGHYPQAEQPDIVNPAVLAFLHEHVEVTGHVAASEDTRTAPTDNR